MKFTISKNDLVSATSKLVNVVPAKTIKPILSGVLIQHTKGKVVFSATDMESSVKVTVECKDYEDDGSFIVDARLLDETAKNMVGSEVEFDFEDNKLQFRTASSKSLIPVMESKDFPDIDFTNEGNIFTFPKAKLLEMIKNVMYACSNNELMRALNCILWEFNTNILQLVASDGYRLAIVKEDILDMDDNSNLHFLVSNKGMKEILDYLNSSQGDVFQFKFNGKTLNIGDDNYKILIRLMDLEFPDYSKIIPLEPDIKTIVVVDKNEILEQLKFSSVVTRLSGDSIKLIINNTQLQIHASTIDRGVADIKFPIQKTGLDITSAFNPDFLMNAIQHLTDSKIILSFVDNQKPIVVSNSNNKNSIHIVMPVRMPS